MSKNTSSPSIMRRLNPSSSTMNFKKSCETILKKKKCLEARLLNNILVYDDPEKALIDDGKHAYIWYLAIGSMINPISLHLRDLTPLISYPVRCPDYRLVFRDHTGMADIEAWRGAEFDGVLHLLPLEQMAGLDQVEHMYKRVTVNTIDYQQCPHLASAYKMTLVREQERPIGIPSERYVDIIVKGCEHFGVRSPYIERLKREQQVVPRKPSTALKTIDNIPEDVYVTSGELSKHDGKNSSLPIWINVNGKILEYTGLPSIDHPDYENQKRFYEFVLSYLAGREVTRAISRAWYEPMHKLPLNDEDLCDEHRALAEDMCVSWGLTNSANVNESYWNPIGRLVQESKIG